MPISDFRFHFPLRVRWAECDAQGIAFNGAYLTWLEVAQAEYYRHLGFSLYRLARTGYFDTVLARVVVEYRAPARPDDLLEIYARIPRLGEKSLTFEVEVYRQGEEHLLARMEAVYVGYDSARGESKRVPADLRRLITHFEETGEVLPLEEFPHLLPAREPPGLRA